MQINLYKFPIYLNFSKPLFPKGKVRTKENVFWLTVFSFKSLADLQMTNIQKKGIAFGCVVVMLSECSVFSFWWYLCSHMLSLKWFESKWQTSWHLTPKYFSMCLLRMRILFCIKPQCYITLQKANIIQ